MTPGTEPVLFSHRKPKGLCLCWYLSSNNMFSLLVHFHDVLLQNTVIPCHPVPIAVNMILPLATHAVIYVFLLFEPLSSFSPFI